MRTASQDNKSSIRTLAVAVTKLGDPGRAITGKPSKEESRELARGWYHSDGEAEGNAERASRKPAAQKRK